MKSAGRQIAMLWGIFGVVALLMPAAVIVAEAAAVATTASMENNVLHFSYELARWLDVDKRPCHDFYGYVCGKSVNNSGVQLEQRLQREQAKFDKFIWTDNNEQLMDAELKLKQFYESCKNARSVEELKSSLMYRTSGGWPAIDDTAAMTRKRRSLTWLQLAAVFHEAGVEYFFRTRIELRVNRRVVHIETDDTARYTLRKFEQLASEVMQEYAVDAGRARLIALEILNFERNRREIVLNGIRGEPQELEYSTFSSSYWDGVDMKEDWDAYFKKIVGKALRPSDLVIVEGASKLKELVALTRNTTVTRLLNWIWIDYLMDKSSANCQNLVQQQLEPVYQHIVQRSSLDRVQMAQMYADIGRAYDEVLVASPWVDEISNLNSKHFLGRVIHLTLNGDSKLDDDYADLTLTNRNFYRNIEKTQRYLMQRRRQQLPTTRNNFTGAADAGGGDASQAASQFFRIFLYLNEFLQQQNLSIPLNYALVGERFAEQMIASGSTSNVAGAWRSMDSEHDFSVFKQCIKGPTGSAPPRYDVNNLVLKLLAERQTLHAFGQWLEKDAAMVRRLNGLLGAGRLQLSLMKLYFIASALAECRQGARVEQPELMHAHLRNSPDFTQAFGCRMGDELYAANVCQL